MFEWGSVTPEDFTNPVTGETVTIRLRHKPDPVSIRKTVNVNGREIDQVVRDEMGDYNEIYKLAEANSRVLSESFFDIRRIREMVVPV